MKKNKKRMRERICMNFHEMNIETLLNELTEAAGKSEEQKIQEIKKVVLDKWEAETFDRQSYVGKRLNDWFCNGFFGSETDVNLDDAVIISVGYDTVEVVETNGKRQIAYFEDGWRQQMKSLLDEWIEGKF
jgi:hypothetical protein